MYKWNITSKWRSHNLKVHTSKDAWYSYCSRCSCNELFLQQSATYRKKKVPESIQTTSALKMHGTFVVLMALLLNSLSLPSKEDYCQVSCPGTTKHTVCTRDSCKPVQYCRQELITPDIRNEIIKLHNTLRNNVATQNNSDIPYSAANMRVMNYDMELEYIAQCITNKCKVTGSECGTTQSFKNVGNMLSQDTDNKYNIFKWLGTDFILQQYKNSFYRMKQMDHSNFEDVYTGKLVPGASGSVAFFTQLIWAENDHMGCAFNTLRGGSETNKTYVFYMYCLYSVKPVKNKKIFIVGPPCSQCTSGTECNVEYKGLCGELLPIPNDSSYNSIYPDNSEEEMLKQEEMEIKKIYEYELMKPDEEKKEDHSCQIKLSYFLLLLMILFCMFQPA